MEWFETPESSSMLRFRYEEETQTLEVEFKSGGCYQYFDVPEPVYEALCRADSKGTFLASDIKGRFRYARC